MSRQQGMNATPNTNSKGAGDVNRPPGWTTDAELVREFDQSDNMIDAVSLTIDDAIRQWPELSETPSLYQFVDVERLEGLFRTKAMDDGGWFPSVEFRFQSCWVTLLYGSSIRVIVERDP